MSRYSRNKIKGATMVEYVLIVGLVSVAAAVILKTLGITITNLFTKINTSLTSG